METTIQAQGQDDMQPTPVCGRPAAFCVEPVRHIIVSRVNPLLAQDTVHPAGEAQRPLGLGSAQLRYRCALPRCYRHDFGTLPGQAIAAAAGSGLHQLLRRHFHIIKICLSPEVRREDQLPH